ncbi:hypothetical protein N6H18_03700 [Reichenbachiella agarivorans]|uniref:Uncharacterized protein n=1 Tax=Reichenbachiella agarivorans TaxID=2979464 RepID=A0ABY6CRD8_9BACT|nr:hypothetical protein [Reichenbachiella agarivorans]UXP33061.1 hypothetical protein N6H18_03700 [Reichenbachiella agarivorans]
MKLIWYNSITKCYEYGDTKEFRTIKSNLVDTSTITILMEFSQNNDMLAQKVISELNMAKKESLTA